MDYKAPAHAGRGDRAFRRGCIDALPIFLGYFAVGFTVAVAAVVNGHPVWSPVLLSLTHVSGTSQGAIVNNVNFTAGLFPGAGELVLLCLTLNLRYVLLSLAVAQRLPPSASLAGRLLVAPGITDEIVAVAVSRRGPLALRYVAGLFVTSYAGWNAGTVAGAFGTTLLPASALAPLGVSLYGMFVAIITPMARKSAPVLACVVLAAVLNVAIRMLPEGRRPSDGVATLVAGVAAATAAAAAFPRRKDDRDGGGDRAGDAP